MSDPTCSIPECDRPTKRKAMCYGHYMKQWRYGTTHPEHERQHHDLAGQTFGQLTAVRWLEGHWECRCTCGATRRARSAELLRGSTIMCGVPSRHWSDDVEYQAAHDRVRSLHGSASDHDCVDCGGPAAHWSYDHRDPHERTSQSGSRKGLPYSTNPDHYEPRCVPCHKAFDLGRERAAAATL